MTLDEIEKLIARHGSVTAEPLRDLIITVVLEAVEKERNACEQAIRKMPLAFAGRADMTADQCANEIRRRGIDPASRAEFEQWAESFGWCVDKTYDGDYRVMSTDAAWGGWHAAARLERKCCHDLALICGKDAPSENEQKMARAIARTIRYRGMFA